MQAIILMAGKGTRMAKYYEGPKQLLPVAGKPVMEYLLETLPEEIKELIFVVGGPHEQTLRDYFKTGESHGRPITFVRQEEQLGLAHAFFTAKDLIHGRWYGSVADDIYDPAAMRELVKQDLGLYTYRVPNPEQFGVLVADDDGYVVTAVEKPKEFVSNLIWGGAMVMDESFFSVKIQPSARGEYETPDVWMQLIREQGKKIKIVESSYWFPVNDKSQLDAAEAKMRELGLA